MIIDIKYEIESRFFFILKEEQTNFRFHTKARTTGQRMVHIADSAGDGILRDFFLLIDWLILNESLNQWE